MDQHPNSSGQMSDFFDQLPTPPKEKVVRAIWYLGFGLIGLVGVLFIMPFVIQALSLGVTGAWLLVKLGAILVAGTAGASFVMAMWSPFNRWLESIARQTTAAIFGDDPITPLKLWLKEVHADCDVIESSAHEIEGVIVENEQEAAENQAKLIDADKRYAQAVKSFGEDSEEAQIAAIDADSFKTRADNAVKANIPLNELYQVLFDIAKTTRLREKKAEADVITAEKDWRTALKAERAMGSARRALNQRSERYQNATMAFDIIRQKYAGSFGELRSLRRMSQAAINQTKLSGAVASDDALQRLREKSQRLLSYNPGVPAHDFSKDPQVVPVSSSASTAAGLDLFGKN